MSKAIESVNKVLARQNSGFYSSARYAKAAFTNVANRLGKAVIKQQAKHYDNIVLLYENKPMKLLYSPKFDEVLIVEDK